MKTQSGSVLIYVLIAIALFAALSFALTRSGGESGAGGRLSDDRAALKAQELIHYATSARSTIEQMRGLSNVLPTEFNFVRIGAAGYDTAPHTAKVFHPAGGGLSVFTNTADHFESGSAARGWSAQQGTNVEWTSSTASDIIFTFVDVSEKICAAINQRLYRDKTIPAVTLNATEIFINGGSDDVDFTVASCAACNGKTSLCVQDGGGAYAFYNVVLGR